MMNKNLRNSVYNSCRFLFFAYFSVLIFPMNSFPKVANQKQNMEQLSIIPNPQTIKSLEGFFRITPEIVILCSDSSNELRTISRELADMIFTFTDLQLSIDIVPESEIKPHSIVLSLRSAKESLGNEGYELTISPKYVTLRAFRPAGLFYGVQTFCQILSSASSNEGQGAKSLPCMEITDHPQFPWRGLLLDCARHFMEKDFIKRYIDLLAYHKMNVLHLHLTDDQGWRIEIQKYPELTKTGAWRGEGENRYGGFYSKEDIREIVDYASSKYIHVIPEFEMPGHASAAIASYPELSCHGNPVSVVTEWGIFKDVFCPGKETTFEFIKGVLEEIIDLFPSPYIHIGGDEAPRKYWEECPHCQERIKTEGLKNEHELQSYLIRRVENFLSQHGRRLIGWDEILEGGGLPPTAIVQSWRGMAGAIEASKLGHDVISSPNPYVYFDYPQTEEQAETKPDWMMVTPLKKVYSFVPVPSELTPQQAEHVLGSECTMWTEHAPQPKVDQQLFPRLCAFCETVWSSPDSRNWENFEQRLQVHYSRLEKWNVEYYQE